MICRILPGSKVADPPDENVTPARSMLSPSTSPLMVVVGIDVLSIFSCPPDPLKVTPPLATLPACNSTTPPEIVTGPVEPPDDTTSLPPPNTKMLLVVVPARLNVPPLDTPMLCAVPPAATFNVPPLETAR